MKFVENIVEKYNYEKIQNIENILKLPKKDKIQFKMNSIYILISRNCAI
jgi:hypothetical protein